jgi:hypothetical protein
MSLRQRAATTSAATAAAASTGDVAAVSISTRANER